MRTNLRLLFTWLMIFTFVLAACNKKEVIVPTQVPLPTATEAPQATATTAPSPTVAFTDTPAATSTPTGLVSSYKNVRKATIQIEAQGTFIDPQVGLVVNGAGRGSGFIIDPSGIAVTANHVVTGSGIFKVWVGGDTDTTYNAKVLGVSECSDLAVIKIDGEGFDYLDWYSGSIDAGMDIYIAGFPLGDPEFTLNKGIVSKSKAHPLMSQTDVESVIEVDATANPGNSGGPIVDEYGQVVAVLYAGSKSTGQSFGISAAIAKDVVEELRGGNNLEFIGVNGQAVRSDDGSVSGIWVSSVKSGSPADEAGLKGGDIILQMEDLVLATEGTMKEYCDILRSHNESDTLSITVLRWSEKQILKGQINGRALEVTGTFGDGSSSDTGGNGSEQSGGQESGDTQQPNMNATNSGDIYFRADFTQKLNNWFYYRVDANSNKIVNNDEGFTLALEQGKLKINFTENYTYMYLIYNPLSAADIRIDAKVENLGRNNNNVSLICRYSDRGWYEFNIANNGLYNILRYDTSQNRYITIATGGSKAIKMGQGINVYTAVCSGDHLVLYINGTETYSGKDSRLTEGRAGISFSSFNVLPITFNLEEFILSVP